MGGGEGGGGGKPEMRSRPRPRPGESPAEPGQARPRPGESPAGAGFRVAPSGWHGSVPGGARGSTQVARATLILASLLFMLCLPRMSERLVSAPWRSRQRRDAQVHHLSSPAASQKVVVADGEEAGGFEGGADPQEADPAPVPNARKSAERESTRIGDRESGGAEVSRAEPESAAGREERPRLGASEGAGGVGTRAGTVENSKAELGEVEANPLAEVGSSSSRQGGGQSDSGEAGPPTENAVPPTIKGGINVAPRDGCLAPALPDDEAFHIVLGGHKYLSDEQVAHHYLWDLQIPNMKIVIYRRVRLQKPGRRWAGPCGMTAEERLIINRGREASAFFDYIAAVRRGDLGLRPPGAFAFLHGHAATAWHTSCQAVFTRILNFYMQMVQPKAEMEGLDRHMLSLTSKASGGLKGITTLSDHRGLSQGIRGSGEEFLSKTNTTFHREEEEAKQGCFEIFRRYGLDLPYGTQARFRSQSASFVSSWERFATSPAGLAEEMLARFTAKNMTDTLFIPELNRNVTREYFWSIHCFEFSVYELFPPPPSSPALTGRQVRQFYSKQFARDSFPWPVQKNERMARCKKAVKGCSPKCIANRESVYPALQRADARNREAGLPEVAFLAAPPAP